MEDRLFWCRLDKALGRFCLDQSKGVHAEGNRLVSSAVGTELEWCGSQTLLFMTADLFSAHSKILLLEEEVSKLQGSLEFEQSSQVTLRKQLRDVEQAADDATWTLQDKLQRTTRMFQSERETAASLRTAVSENQAKLEDIEGTSSSSLRKLEEDLSYSRNRIEQLEAERDELKRVQKDASITRASSSTILKTSGKENAMVAEESNTNTKFVQQIHGSGGLKSQLRI